MHYTTEQLIKLNAQNRSKYLGGMGILPGGRYLVQYRRWRPEPGL